jgi:hypothetical protein
MFLDILFIPYPRIKGKENGKYAPHPPSPVLVLPDTTLDGVSIKNLTSQSA